MDRAELQLRRSKAKDRSLALVIIGAALLLPPLAGLFQMETKLFGLPVTLVYLFFVWALLIAGAARLASRLSENDES